MTAPGKAMRAALNALTDYATQQPFGKPCAVREAVSLLEEALATPLSSEGDSLDAGDGRRLDWIFRQADEFSQHMIVDAPGDGEYVIGGMGNAFGQGKTPREALDAAIDASMDAGGKG